MHIHNKTLGHRMGVIVNNTLESYTWWDREKQEKKKNFADSPQPRFGWRTFQIGCRSATRTQYLITFNSVYQIFSLYHL